MQIPLWNGSAKQLIIAIETQDTTTGAALHFTHGILPW